MRIYKKYTNFIPDSYIKSLCIKNTNGEFRMIKIMVILSIIALPISLSTILQYKKISEKSILVVEEKSEIDKSTSLIKWIEFMEKEKFNIEIEDVKGLIRLNEIKEIKNIEECGLLNINSVKQENNHYNIEVSIK